MEEIEEHKSELGSPSNSAYMRKCRCPECKACHSKDARERRAAWKARDSEQDAAQLNESEVDAFGPDPVLHEAEHADDGGLAEDPARPEIAAEDDQPEGPDLARPLLPESEILAEVDDDPESVTVPPEVGQRILREAAERLRPPAELVPFPSRQNTPAPAPAPALVPEIGDRERIVSYLTSLQIPDGTIPYERANRQTVSRATGITPAMVAQLTKGMLALGPNGYRLTAVR